MELKKPHPSRLLRGGAQTRNGLIPHPHVEDKNSRGISWEQGVLALLQTPSLGFQGQEDKSPQLLAAKTSRDSVSGRNYWIPKQFLLKNPHTDSPTQTHSF